MNRRNFLKGALALAAAPAILHAENLMKIYVPKNFLHFDIDFDQKQEYNVSFWMKKPDGEWCLYTKNLNQNEKRDRRIALDVMDTYSSVGILSVNGILQRS